MPPLPNVPAVVRVSLEGTVQGRNWANVFHVRYTGTEPTPTSLSNYLTAWLGVVATEIAPLMDTTTLITGATAVDLTSNTAASAEASLATPGTRAGDLLTANVATLVNYNSSFRYRGGHPRTYYLLGVNADLETANSFTNAFVADVQTFATNMLGYLGTGVVSGTNYTTQCAVSYREGNAPRVTPLVMPIAVATVQAGCATQRRRMRKG
jgi:hypothetical protein